MIAAPAINVDLKVFLFSTARPFLLRGPDPAASLARQQWTQTGGHSSCSSCVPLLHALFTNRFPVTAMMLRWALGPTC